MGAGESLQWQEKSHSATKVADTKKSHVPMTGLSSMDELQPQLIHWSLKYVSRCRMSQFARCFLPAQTHVWNDLPETVFDTGMLDGFKGAVNHWLLP